MKKYKIMLAGAAFLVCAIMAWLAFSIGTVLAADAPADKPDPAGGTYIPEEYQRYCAEIGEQYHICPELLVAMIEAESSGKADAANGKCTGLLQVNPAWHKTRMQRLGVSDLTDAYGNILVAADYLAELFAENEDLYLVLMKYNMPHYTAENYYNQGIYSEYAVNIAERAAELERIKERGVGVWDRD